MIFVSINDKPIKDLKYEELVAFFVQHLFFHFMDNGRSGLNQGTKDMVDNFVKWIETRAVRPGKADLPYDELYLQCSALLIDGFIQRGTQGLRDGIGTSYLVILDSYKPQ